MKSSFWEEPLAEKVVFPTKKKCIPPKYLGFLVRLSFVVAVIIGGIFYYLQDLTQQVLEASPVNPDCKVLGSLDGTQYLIPDVGGGDPLTFELVGTSDTWVSNPANCISLFTRALAQPWVGSTFKSAGESNMETDEVFSPELQAAYDCVIRDNCTKPYVYTDLTRIPGSTLHVLCDVKFNSDFDISAYNCSNANFLKVKQRPVGGLDTFNAEFLCDGRTTDVNLTLLPGSLCLRGHMQADFTGSVKQFCDFLPTKLGPYLCTETSKRSPLDILNLAFAAGSAAVIISTIIVSVLHRVLNGESEETAKPTKGGDATELT